MSEETPKFRVYVSYLKDEAPAELVEELVNRLRGEFGENSVLTSDPQPDPEKSIKECHAFVHILTEHSRDTAQYQTEIKHAFDANLATFTVKTPPAKIEAETIGIEFIVGDARFGLNQLVKVLDELRRFYSQYERAIHTEEALTGLLRLSDAAQYMFMNVRPFLETGLRRHLSNITPAELESHLKQAIDRASTEGVHDLESFARLAYLLRSSEFKDAQFPPSLEDRLRETIEMLIRLNHVNNMVNSGAIRQANQMVEELTNRLGNKPPVMERQILDLKDMLRRLGDIEELDDRWRQAMASGDLREALALFERGPFEEVPPNLEDSLQNRFISVRPESRRLMFLLRDAERLRMNGQDRDALPYLKEARRQVDEYHWYSMAWNLDHQIRVIELSDEFREAQRFAQIGDFRQAELRISSLLHQHDLPQGFQKELEQFREQLLQAHYKRESLRHRLNYLQHKITDLLHRLEYLRHKRSDLGGKLFVRRQVADLDDEIVQVEEEIRHSHEEIRRIEGEIDIQTQPTGVNPTSQLEQIDVKPSRVAFTLFNPSRVHRQIRYSLIAYAHKQEEQSAIQKDMRKFTDELGESPKERHSAEPIPLPPKTEITIVPEVEGITFDPPELTKTWDEKWLRFNFDFEVPDTYKHEEIWLHISVQVKGFEVACIKSSCEVVAKTVAAAAPALPDDPLVDPPKESGTRKADAHLYRNVFLSYSHKDEEIAWRRVHQIESMLGDRVFMDLKDLRAGEDWESRLFEAIDKADILHLLWSENSAQSDFCRREWTYALEKKCGDTRCFGVIRPVYWQKPMPEPPPELAHLHFQQIKLEDE